MAGWGWAAVCCVSVVVARRRLPLLLLSVYERMPLPFHNIVRASSACVCVFTIARAPCVRAAHESNIVRCCCNWLLAPGAQKVCVRANAWWSVMMIFLEWGGVWRQQFSTQHRPIIRVQQEQLACDHSARAIAHAKYITIIPNTLYYYTYHTLQIPCSRTRKTREIKSNNTPRGVCYT